MASSSKPTPIYDVFLSFRGTDLRNNFLGHLYKALDQNGIYTFLDSEELKKGDQISEAIKKAIKESCIAIVVFSNDYASSRWCLDEVAMIMECKEQKDLTVLPVFYKVDPREVRRGRESYGRALAKHESKFGKDSEKVKRWKKALFDAGSLSGWHLNDGDESEVIQSIVKKISTHLDRTPLQVAKHPIGIESQVVKLKSMFNIDSADDVVMVGLWGPGGIGKTTLAKALFNATFRQFEGSCFLADVRETSKGFRGLVTLQEIFLNDTLSLQQRLKVSNVDGGINIIQRRLGRKKVLLVLDDVDDLHQLHALAGESNWFGNGSRIIITTRDKQLLTCHGIDEDHVYEVKPLGYSEAHELFRNHASSRHKKLEIRADLVKSVLNHAKGLPLALVVLGSLLYGTTEDVWESTVKKLSRIPDKAINDVLKISYDGLDENEKEIFLHIACFFKGQAREYTKKVLDSCDLQTAVGLDILIKRSLISIEHKTLKVHDLIQAMGRDIVNQECRDDPGKRSRLWQCDDVLDVLSHDIGDCAVKAIVLEPPELTEICIDPNAFTKMRRLTLLIVHNVSFQGPICLPNGLRWFGSPGCTSWIPEFSSGPKKLVGLDIHESSITAVPKQLKKPPRYMICLPGEEMPQWVLPIEGDSVFFMASKDLYDKFLGFAFCAILNNDKRGNDEQGDVRLGPSLRFVPRVNGKRRYYSELCNEFLYSDSNRIWLEYFIPSELWGVVNFGQIDGSYVQFSLEVSGEIVKKWGFRIICKQLEDDVEVMVQDNQLLDLALLYEVACESTDSEASCSLMQDNSSIEADL